MNSRTFSRKICRHSQIFIVLGSVFLFFTMFFPDSFKFVRLFLFIVLVTSAVDEILLHNLPLGKGRTIFFIYLGYNIFSFFIGLVENAPGALRCQSVDFLWPVLFYLVGMTLNREDDYLYLLKCMVIITIVLSAFDFWYCLGSMGFLPLPRFFNRLNLDLRFGHFGNFVQYMNTHQATLIFMTPFTIALLFDLKKVRAIINPFIIIIALFLEVACLLMSGRVAFQVSSALSLLIVPFYRFRLNHTKGKMHKQKIHRIAFFLICFIIALSICLFLFTWILSLDIIKVWDYIEYKFTSSSSQADNVRLIQFKALMNGWIESPIWGHGTGSYSPLIVREIVDQPWAYELTYCALLYQKGIVGFVVFFGMVFWILHSIFLKIKHGIYSEYVALPFMTGFICFLLANAVDPYLAKFGLMWVLFIPFAMASSEWKSDSRSAIARSISIRRS